MPQFCFAIQTAVQLDLKQKNVYTDFGPDTLSKLIFSCKYTVICKIANILLRNARKRDP